MIPTELHLIALFQLLAGISAVGHVLVELSYGKPFVDLGVLGIPAYFGLMRLSPTWRTWTLAMIVLGLLATPILFVMGLDPDTPAAVEIVGIQLGSVWPGWISVLALPLFVLLAWQYRVLTRPAVAALFERGASTEARASAVEPRTC